MEKFEILSTSFWYEFHCQNLEITIGYANNRKNVKLYGGIKFSNFKKLYAILD